MSNELEHQLPEHYFPGEVETEDDLFEHFRIVVDPGQNLVRIDKFLFDKLPNVSRNRIQNAAHAGTILVNGKETKPSYKVKPLDVITLVLSRPPRDKTVYPENIPITIVYEDDSLLLVNKPAGMVVHPGFGNYTGTLVNALVYHFEHLPTHRNGEIRPGLVHRIDKNTSGLLVIAKTDYAMTFLAKQFFDHTIDRHYQALVWGNPKEDFGTITGNIDRSVRDRKVMDVYPADGDKGRTAVTHYRVLQRFGYVSLLEFTLETGRTHQIRVHAQHAGHPIFNDPDYGGDKILKGMPTGSYKKFVENCFAEMPRLALHAKTLGFTHPATGDRIFFDTPLAPDFQHLLERWEAYTKE